MKFMSFGSTLSYPHEEFLNLRPPRSKYSPHQPRSKFNPHPPRQCGYSQPAQDLSGHTQRS